MRLTKVVMVIIGLMLGSSVLALPKVGEPAPAFAIMSASGEEVALNDYLGKLVVLEWTNHECPYVERHYESGNMQNLQKTMTKNDVVWLTVISSAPGKQGHVNREQANQLTKDRDAMPTQVLFDESGDVGRAYAAKTTPHMYVIDKQGVLQYMGAIDSDDGIFFVDESEATNYVTLAINELSSGKTTVSQAVTKPYGCSVKY